MQQVLSDHHWLHDLRVEPWRRLCRRELVRFCVHVLAPARYHRRICRELESVARGDVPRLMVLAPHRREPQGAACGDARSMCSGMGVASFDANSIGALL
jgi:hypothetical protein